MARRSAGLIVFELNLTDLDESLGSGIMMKCSFPSELSSNGPPDSFTSGLMTPANEAGRAGAAAGFASALQTSLCRFQSLQGYISEETGG